MWCSTIIFADGRASLSDIVIKIQLIYRLLGDSLQIRRCLLMHIRRTATFTSRLYDVAKNIYIYTVVVSILTCCILTQVWIGMLVRREAMHRHHQAFSVNFKDVRSERSFEWPSYRVNVFERSVRY